MNISKAWTKQTERKGNEMKKSVCILWSVSYTHLDVYKRQGYASRKARSSFARRCRISSAGSGKTNGVESGGIILPFCGAGLTNRTNSRIVIQMRCGRTGDQEHVSKKWFTGSGQGKAFAGRNPVFCRSGTGTGVVCAYSGCAARGIPIPARRCAKDADFFSGPPLDRKSVV